MIDIVIFPHLMHHLPYLVPYLVAYLSAASEIIFATAEDKTNV
jgi:hypothetical protein